MSCILEGFDQPKNYYNPLIAPLLNFHGTMAALGSPLPREGKAAEVAYRVGLAILSPLIYLALAFTALAGLILNGFWAKKHIFEFKAASLGAAATLAKETEVFGALKAKTEPEKTGQIPQGAFGKEEWEKNFPVTIAEVPPLPANIHEILELEDPCEPGKRLKETCMLFLRPKNVVLHEEGGDKELLIGYEGMDELAQKGTNPARRTHYVTLDGFSSQMKTMPVADSAWVLMRKGIMNGSRNQSFEKQKELLKGNFEVPKLMDAILLNILIFVTEGKCLFGTKPLTYTRCQEMYKNYQTVVGGFDSSGLDAYYYDFDHCDLGLSGVWKF